MLVYGDPQFESSAIELRTRLEKTLQEANGGSLDSLRKLLVQTGQFEQALVDSENGRLRREQVQRLTDWAACAFYAEWAKAAPLFPAPALPLNNALLSYWRDLGEFDLPEGTVTVKVPEGFSYYALFPEQYALAALTWCREHPSTARPLVVGVRSIGTALSAVVRAVLVAMGWDCQRITVRPTGPPFARELRIPLEYVGRANFALIVDEGPGLSGSSVKAVADALCECGLRYSQLCVLPGHGNGPGAAASEDQIAFWRSVRTYHVPLEDARWNGLTLVQALEFETPECAREGSTVDLSFGKWRSVISPVADDILAIVPFEHMKFKCSSRNQAVLWKFAGFGAWHDRKDDSIEQAVSRSAHRAELGWSVPPIKSMHGFVGVPWIEGEHLTRDQLAAIPMELVCKYVRDIALPPQDAAGHERSVIRLKRVIFRNTQGVFEATQIAPLVERLAPEALKFATPSYGDGDMFSWNWIRTPSGKLFKTGGMAHESDHTVIGSQSILWDMAAHLIEAEQMGASNQMISIMGFGKCASALPFYALGYAAFRFGQIQITQHANPDEQARLERLAALYRQAIQRVLSTVD